MAPVAEAQTTTPDPNYWKQTAERRDAVYRLVYAQSPQTIPSSYDPVAEAEAITAQAARDESARNPRALELWRQLRGITVKSALSSPLRVLGTIGLGVGVFEIGWKIGDGVNAKFLHIGIPEPQPPYTGGYPGLSYSLEYHSGGQIYSNIEPVPEGWRARWTDSDPQTSNGYGFSDDAETCSGPPPGFGVRIGHGPSSSFYVCNWGDRNNPDKVNKQFHVVIPGENGLGAPAPLEDYHGQPYDRYTPAPTPPPQDTVEQRIDDYLASAEGALLRQWINYQMGSPGEEDPMVGTMPDCLNVSGPTCQQRVRDAGFVHIRTIERTQPDYNYAPEAVVETRPTAGSRRDLGTDIEIEVNPPPQWVRDKSDRDEEDCSLTPEAPVANGPTFEVIDYFDAWDHPDPVPLYRGTPWFGYQHIATRHGWGPPEALNLQRALADTYYDPPGAVPGPNPRSQSDGSRVYYYSWTAANGQTHCTTAVLVQYTWDPSDPPGSPTKYIITSYAYVGWYQKYPLP